MNTAEETFLADVVTARDKLNELFRAAQTLNLHEEILSNIKGAQRRVRDVQMMFKGAIEKGAAKCL